MFRNGLFEAWWIVRTSTLQHCKKHFHTGRRRRIVFIFSFAAIVNFSKNIVCGIQFFSVFFSMKIFSVTIHSEVKHFWFVLFCSIFVVYFFFVSSCLFSPSFNLHIVLKVFFSLILLLFSYKPSFLRYWISLKPNYEPHPPLYLMKHREKKKGHFWYFK